ncbi:hypothetical protein PIB30_000166 [Stylosanthes scabra]|uniref:Uncharacterized protein n=1 Tax=Stylosanthes scabra TaxID=79078 RepID=A0ABU6R2B7_9FABA|nr:hypothetical protein [Stylosanthes scabra]
MGDLFLLPSFSQLLPIHTLLTNVNNNNSTSSSYRDSLTLLCDLHSPGAALFLLFPSLSSCFEVVVVGTNGDLPILHIESIPKRLPLFLF